MEKPKVKEILKEFDEWLHTEIHSVTVDGVTRPATDSDRVDFIISCWEQASDELYKLGILSDHLDELEKEKEIEKTAQEVPVQEQFKKYIGKCNNCKKLCEVELPLPIKPNFCGYCGSVIQYTNENS